MRTRMHSAPSQQTPNLILTREVSSPMAGTTLTQESAQSILPHPVCPHTHRLVFHHRNLLPPVYLLPLLSRERSPSPNPPSPNPPSPSPENAPDATVLNDNQRRRCVFIFLVLVCRQDKREGGVLKNGICKTRNKCWNRLIRWLQHNQRKEDLCQLC